MTSFGLNDYIQLIKNDVNLLPNEEPLSLPPGSLSDRSNLQNGSNQSCNNTSGHIVNYTPIGESNKIIYITKTGAFIKFSYINTTVDRLFKIVRRIENYFTLKFISVIGQPIQRKRCHVDKKNQRIIVPRFGIFEILSKKFHLEKYTTISQLKPGHNIDKFNWQGYLQPNQDIISRYMLDHIYTKERVKHGSAGCILKLATGQGKTYLAAYLMSIFKKKTLIILHSTAMIQQWHDVISACYPTISIGYYYGQKKIDGDVIIMVINSVINTTYIFNKTILSAIEYYNQFGFIIYDECHLYANNFNGKAFYIAQAPYMLGLSATPEEHTYKFDKLVWWSIGPVLDAETLPGYMTHKKQFKATVHQIKYYGPDFYTQVLRNDGSDFISPSKTINMICMDEQRSQLIIDYIQQCLKQNLYVFVFADRRDYLSLLRDKLITQISQTYVEMMINDTDYMRIVGQSTPKEVQLAESKAKVIFTTYQYMGTGKSIPKMNSLILTTPRKSKISQYVGRIFRLSSDESIERHIYDIVDMKTVFKNQWYVRKKFYVERGYNIVQHIHNMEKK